LSPMRYLNPQRSKSLQDRKGWIEGWEPRIKADEFIHGLGIGEAYLRHNGRPARVKLVRADINPPRDFDLSESLPRFSQGNEPPLNLTEKVNKVVMERMRAAKGTPKEDTHNTFTGGESKRKNHKLKGKVPEKPSEKVHEITAKDAAEVINNQPTRSEGLRENASKQSATQIDSLTAQRSPELLQTSEESGPGATNQKQSEKLDWFSTWDED